MSWYSRAVNVFRASKVDRDIDEELHFHLQTRIDELMAQGAAREAAEAEAARRLGNRLRIREASRDVKLLPWLESIVRDLFLALRMLRKDAVVSGAAVLSLGLAIGACGAAFSLLDALVLRPLPVRDPDRLIYLTWATRVPERPEADTFSYPLLDHFRKGADQYVDLFAVGYLPTRPVVFPDAAGTEEKLRVAYISGSAFETLGITPAIGRVLAASDDATPGAHPVAVLSHAFWTRRFGGDRTLVGRSLLIDKRPFEILGVARRGFTGVEPGLLADLWLPTMMQDPKAFTDATWSWFRIVGRLRASVATEQARSVLQTLFTNFRREQARLAPPDVPREELERYVNTPLWVRSAANGPSALRQRFERPLWILAIIVGLVLLIAGSNVANLFLARAAAREREMSLRLSIGAGRGRLIQQVLVESGLLATAACLLGLLFTFAAAPIVVGMLTSTENPAYLDLRLDWPLMALLGGIAALTTALFGLAPALRASAVAPIGVLNTRDMRLAPRAGLLRPLIALQAGFSLVVLFVAGLLLMSFGHLMHLNPGFAASDLLLISVSTREPLPAELARVAGLQLIEHVRQLPGVDSAGLSNWALFSGSSWMTSVSVPDRPTDRFDVNLLRVSPGFFQTMRVRLVDGREFVPRDTEPDTPPVVIVSEAFAKQYFGETRAVGRTLDRILEAWTVGPEIVGVVADVKYNDLRLPSPPMIYVPHRGLGTLQVRTAGNPLALASVLRGEVPLVHPSLRVTDVQLQSALIDSTLIRERLLALLSGFFAVVGLLLAAVGLYGVLNYSIVQRTREIGIRIALGAQPLTVARTVVARVGLMTALGMVGGLACALLLLPFVKALLFEVEPLDAWSLLLPIACLTAAGLVAAVPPARRAVRVDPVVALRVE